MLIALPASLIFAVSSSFGSRLHSLAPASLGLRRRRSADTPQHGPGARLYQNSPVRTYSAHPLPTFPIKGEGEGAAAISLPLDGGGPGRVIDGEVLLISSGVKLQHRLMIASVTHKLQDDVTTLAQVACVGARSPLQFIKKFLKATLRHSYSCGVVGT
ncbi:MAG TPA: hypothetical protein VJ770_09105 [Stellaceae bacterium]|nr:hypothetical protein [Stellaceae bacterium]